MGQPASAIQNEPITDRECLAAWRHQAKVENLRPLLDRYGALVHTSALRQTGTSARAAEVTRAVFLVLARRARKLRKKTVLAGWLFSLTALACRKLMKKQQRGRWRRWLRRKLHGQEPTDARLWTRVAPELDRAIQRLSVAQRNAVLLQVILRWNGAAAARVLRTSERRAQNCVERGLDKLARRLRWCGVPGDVETLRLLCSVEACADSVPEELASTILESIETTRRRKPTFKLARRVLRALAWQRWRRRLVFGLPAFMLLLVVVAGIAWHIDSLSGHSRLISAFIIRRVRFEVNKVAEPARPWPSTPAKLMPDARSVHHAQDIYRTTNIWLAHLSFTREQWKGLEPKAIGPMPNFMLPDGMVLLRNPKAARSGIAGVLGYEFDWSGADFEFGGVAFSNVAVRAKGNIGSLVGLKRSFKMDLNRLVKGQKLASHDEFVFNNLMWDYSCLSDALGYELFRDAGVPAPRTAYAWFSVSVARQWDRKPFGLYLMVEPVDKRFAAERSWSKETPLFKPVTYHLFEDLGNDWAAYAAIYDLKTTATPEQQRRLIEFARLVSSAPDPKFAAQVGDFLDLDEFARFLAVEVLLASYDSILSDGQNFFMYLDVQSNKFGFIPWDLDSAWGDFWIGTRLELEHASIWHPWVGKNQFLERVMAVEQFRKIYRAHLEACLDRLFVPPRLQQRIHEMAAILRGPVAAESSFRLNKFEQEVGAKPVEPSPGESRDGVNHPAYPLMRFVAARAKSVRHQLAGKSTGVILKPPAEK